MLTYADMAFPRLPASEELARRGDGNPAGSAFLQENVCCLRRWVRVISFVCPLHEHQRQENRPRLICTPIQDTQTRTRGCQEAPGERCERMSHPAFLFGGGRADGRAMWRDVKEMQSWGEYNGVSFRYDLIAPCSHHATFMAMRSAWRSGSLRACCSECINVYTCTNGKTFKPLVYQESTYTSTNIESGSEIYVRSFLQSAYRQTMIHE